jgi:hypothetical protein
MFPLARLQSGSFCWLDLAAKDAIDRPPIDGASVAGLACNRLSAVNLCSSQCQTIARRDPNQGGNEEAHRSLDRRSVIGALSSLHVAQCVAPSPKAGS